MADLVKGLDLADRMLVAGALNLGRGVVGMIEIETILAASGEVALFGTLSTVGALAISPVLLVAGVYALTAPEKERQDLFAAVSEVNAVTKMFLRPIDWLEDKLKERCMCRRNSSSTPTSQVLKRKPAPRF
jgi:hypothetical protein